VPADDLSAAILVAEHADTLASWFIFARQPPTLYVSEKASLLRRPFSLNHGRNCSTCLNALVSQLSRRPASPGCSRWLQKWPH